MKKIISALLLSLFIAGPAAAVEYSTYDATSTTLNATAAVKLWPSGPKCEKVVISGVAESTAYAIIGSKDSGGFRGKRLYDQDTSVTTSIELTALKDGGKKIDTDTLWGKASSGTQYANIDCLK